MAFKTATGNGLSLTAYQGDFKTLLAYSFDDKSRTKNLAGFTISFAAGKGAQPEYIFNNLRFERPGVHAQVATAPANASINAPIHKFRWLHVPSGQQSGAAPVQGNYTYTVTPRYFDGKGSMLAIDPTLSASVDIDVVPFVKGKLQLGMTRGFMQSQAFVRHFGPHALVRPKDYIYDTSKQAGTDPQGKPFTYASEYEWMGFTARTIIFSWLDEVIANEKLSVDVFAYDLNEPDVVDRLLKLAASGRIRIILDNASLHHAPSGKPPKPEDKFEQMFKKAKTGEAQIVRGKFASFSHDKVFIVKQGGTPVKVLTGSTNFSVTGMYVNANHVITIDNADVAAQYAKVFDDALTFVNEGTAYAKTPDAAKTFSWALPGISKLEITYSPHTNADAQNILGGIAKRVEQEATESQGNVFFAVMDVSSSGTATAELLKVHANQKIFSYGITDTTKGIELYKPGSAEGVLVTGKPAKTFLPPPFDQVPGVGLGHQVHHKFVVCGFNRSDAVVYCGSSNLAQGGEQKNGDNLLAIHDPDVATAFAIEAVSLVDHFQFLDKSQRPGTKVKVASKLQQATDAGWFLSTDDKWTNPYYDSSDLKCLDRELFANVGSGSGEKAASPKGTVSPVKKAAAKKAAVKKAPVKKSSVKKSSAKKSPVRRTPATNTAAKRTPAKKAPVKKSKVKSKRK